MQDVNEQHADLRCVYCQAKPLVRWLDDNDVWRWLCCDCAAARGNPTAVYLQTSAWIDSQIQRVIPVEGVQ